MVFPALRVATSLWAARLTGFRVLPAPFLMVWEATGSCNAACRYCLLTHETASGSLLDAGEVIRIIEQAARLGLFGVVVTGGEPLVRPDLFTVVRRCRELGLFLSLTTNGTRLASVSDESLRLFDHITVSIDSVDPAVYAARRGSDELPSVLAGILDARRRCERTVINAQAVVDRENWHQILALSEFFHGHGIDTVFQLVYGEDVPFEPAAWERLVARLPFHSRSLGVLHRRFLRLFPAVSRGSAWVPCLALLASFVLSPAGDVLPCSFRREPVADLRHRPFGEVWASLNSARRDMLRRARTCNCGSTCFVMPALTLAGPHAVKAPRS